MSKPWSTRDDLRYPRIWAACPGAIALTRTLLDPPKGFRIRCFASHIGQHERNNQAQGNAPTWPGGILCVLRAPPLGMRGVARNEC